MLGLLAATPAAQAQSAFEDPATVGIPGAALLANPFPLPPGGAPTPTVLAQNAPESPAAVGIPGAAPLANPFPVPPEAPSAPNYQYQSNLEPAIGALPTPGFQVVPRLSAFEEFNDNILQSQTDRRYDFITLLSPGVAVTADTPKLTLRFNYNPIFRIFARTPSQDSIGQQALGVADATVVPDEFYVRARLYADDVPTNGALGGLNFGAPAIGNTGLGSFGGGAAASLSKANLTQVESSQLFPYLVYQFGDAGTGKFGINLTQTYSSRTSGTLLTSSSGPAQHFETGEAIAQFQSGEGLGQFVDIATLDASASTGTGVQANATRAVADNRLGYAISHAVLVFGDLGAESIQYPNAVPPLHITDAIWGAGTTLQPNPDSQITLEYGHFDGVTSFRAVARYAVTARSVLTASYSAGIATDLQQIATQVANITVNPQGNPINLDTGAPASVLAFATGINPSVNKTQTLTATAMTLLDRDTISLNLVRTNETPIANARGVTPAVPNTSLSVSASERHEFTERASVTATVQGGTRTLQAVTPENEQFYGASLALKYVFSDKLYGYATYNYFDRLSNVPTVPFYENVVLVGVTRTF